MTRAKKPVYPPDPRRTPLYTAWQQARDRFHAHGFNQSRYDAVRAARRAYLASVGL
jgi:hypothetical protein